MRRRALSVILAAAVVAGAACSGGDDDAAPVRTTTSAPVVAAGTLLDRDCLYDPPLAERATCHWVEVPEDRTRPEGRTVLLAVTVLHSRAATPEPDPVVYLHGGPGGDATPGARGWEGDAILDTRDIVLWDQRGTGASDPSLNCPEVDDDIVARFTRVAPYETERASREDAWRECRARLLDEGVDLDQYDTEASADDLESLRLALGVDEWNLLGVSYGTRLALAYLREYSEHVRTVLLDSVVPPGAGGIDHLVASAQRAVRQLVDGCAEVPACAAAHPDFATAVDRAFDQLEDRPFGGDVDLGPAAGGVKSLAIDGHDALAGLFTALYDKDLIVVLPSVVEAVARGDYSLIPAIAQQGIPFAVGFADGAAISVSCADNQAILDERDAELVAEPGRYAVLAAESADTFCELWDVEPVSDGFHDPVGADVPAMVTAGRYDPVTPPADSEAVARELPRAVYAEWDGVGHGVLFSGAPCAGDAYLRLLETAEPPDLSCAADAPPPAFAG